jgi:hypothetical protein
MNEKQKTILFVMGTLLSIPFTIWFIVFFRDFFYLIAFVSTALACIGLTGYGLYEEIHQELTFRHIIHEQLYHGKSKEYAKRLDFFLDYFGDSEYK